MWMPTTWRSLKSKNRVENLYIPKSTIHKKDKILQNVLEKSVKNEDCNRYWRPFI